MASELKKVYNLGIRQNDMCLQLVDPKMSKTERMALAVKVPCMLDVHRPLTAQEQQQSGYTMLHDDPVRIKSKAGQKDVELGFCRYLSPLVVYNEPGLWKKLCEIQYILANPDFIDYLEKSHPFLKAHLSKRGTVYDLGLTVEPGHRPEGIHMGPAARKGSADLQTLHILMSEVYQACMKLSALHVDHSKRWAANASVTVGHHQNHDLTAAQVNYSEQGKSPSESIKSKAHVHVDGNDDPTRFTVLPFLNNLDGGIYEGIMNLTAAKLSCPGEKFGVLVFSGRTPHALTGYGKVEAGFDHNSIDKSHRPPENAYPVLPENFFKGRISLPMYPRLDSICARYTEVASSLWDDNAITIFGTKQNHMEWKMRFYIKDALDEILQKGMTADELCQLFPWMNEAGEIQYPDRDVAQLCLDWAGKTVEEYDELFKAAIYANCGNRIPELDEDGEILVKVLTRKRKFADEEHFEWEEEYTKVQCDFMKAKAARCKTFFWPDPANMGRTRCGRHVGQ